MPRARRALHELMDAAGLTQICSERLAHRGLDETAARLRTAAATFTLNEDQCLATHLWTDPNDLWTSKTRGTHIAGPLNCSVRPPRFLCCHASEANARALYWYNARPQKIDNRLDGSFAAGGPYLTLVRCDQDWTDLPRLAEGYAQSIWSSDVPFPVNSANERALLATLAGFADGLDARGLDLHISRSLTPQGLDDVIVLALSNATGRLCQVALTCVPSSQAAPEKRAGLPIRHISPADLADHRFLRWLAEQVAGTIPRSCS